MPISLHRTPPRGWQEPNDEPSALSPAVYTGRNLKSGVGPGNWTLALQSGTWVSSLLSKCLSPGATFKSWRVFWLAYMNLWILYLVLTESLLCDNVICHTCNYVVKWWNKQNSLFPPFYFHKVYYSLELMKGTEYTYLCLVIRNESVQGIIRDGHFFFGSFYFLFLSFFKFSSSTLFFPPFSSLPSLLLFFYKICFQSEWVREESSA